MKTVRFLIFIVIFLFFLSIAVSATDVEKEVTDVISDELSGFKESLPSFVLDFLPDGLLEGDFSLLLSDELNEKSFLNYAIDYLFASLGTVIKTFCSILILILLSSIFEMLSSSLKNSSLSTVFIACSTLTVSLSVFNVCISLCNYTTTYINALCQAMNAFVPIMGAVQIMSGNLSSASLSNATMVLFISVTEGFLVAFMLPLVKICMMLSCTKSLGGIELGGFTRIIRNTLTSVTVFTMSIFMFVLSMKNILTASIDSLSIKTARFAISSFVPLVGASVNDALRTVSSSLSFIKSSCGVIAIIVIALIILPLIIYLFLNKVAFSLLSSISIAIKCERQGDVLKEADSLCTYMLTLVACTSVLFIFALTIFIKTEMVLNG